MTTTPIVPATPEKPIGGDGIKTCMVCGAPLDAEGVNCTRINAPCHDDFQSDYYGRERDR